MISFSLFYVKFFWYFLELSNLQKKTYFNYFDRYNGDMSHILVRRLFLFNFTKKQWWFYINALWLLPECDGTFPFITHSEYETVKLSCCFKQQPMTVWSEHRLIDHCQHLRAVTETVSNMIFDQSSVHQSFDTEQKRNAVISTLWWDKCDQVYLTLHQKSINQIKQSILKNPAAWRHESPTAITVQV